MENLSKIVREFVLLEGACASGISTLETLEGGPPSSDLTYVLPGAKSAVTFAVAIDQRPILPYLMKKERLALEKAFIQANVLASGIALHLSNYLTQKGFPSVPVAANNVFRPPDPTVLSEFVAESYYPDIAHRYLAVRSGVGHLGLSGNLITKNQGAAVILATTVTSAHLLATPPLPSEESYCDNCRLCMASCVAEFMSKREETNLALGGHEVTYSKRRHYGRCDPVCSGYTGLHSSGKWSTWSPGRFAIPKSDDQLRPAYERMQSAHSKWPTSEGGRYFFFLDEKLRVSCANCQLVCCPDKNERKYRYKMLTNSGVIIQNTDGSRSAVSPERAKEIIASMSTAQRGLYQDI
ncbi:MAG: epoxyqueuosine reductase [Desulforhopalus sp.]|jgi:epoxyqueuosine reductase